MEMKDIDMDHDPEFIAVVDASNILERIGYIVSNDNNFLHIRKPYTATTTRMSISRDGLVDSKGVLRIIKDTGSEIAKSEIKSTSRLNKTGRDSFLELLREVGRDGWIINDSPKARPLQYVGFFQGRFLFRKADRSDLSEPYMNMNWKKFEGEL